MSFLVAPNLGFFIRRWTAVGSIGVMLRIPSTRVRLFVARLAPRVRDGFKNPPLREEPGEDLVAQDAPAVREPEPVVRFF